MKGHTRACIHRYALSLSHTHTFSTLCPILSLGLTWLSQVLGCLQEWPKVWFHWAPGVWDLKVEYKKDLEKSKSHSINYCETPQFRNVSKISKFTSDVSHCLSICLGTSCELSFRVSRERRFVTVSSWVGEAWPLGCMVHWLPSNWSRWCHHPDVPLPACSDWVLKAGLCLFMLSVWHSGCSRCWMLHGSLREHALSLSLWLGASELRCVLT